jgi:hypothetical protein
MKLTIATAPLAAIGLIALAACTNPYDPGQRALGGAGIGAGAGALLGGALGGGSGALTGALAGGAVGALAGVATTPPPPPPRVGYRPPPGPAPAAMVWDPGRWQWTGRTYVWVEGHYIQRPYRSAVWVPGRWEHRRGEWVWFDGHWRS